MDIGLRIGLLAQLFAAVGGAPAPGPTPPPPPGPTPPPPPPAPPLDGAQFTLTSADTGTRNFQKGISFAQGEVPAGQQIVFSGANARYTPKTYHPDGSLDWAVVVGSAALSPTPAVVTMALGTPSAAGAAVSLAALRASGITCTFSAGAFGSATWAANSADWEAPHYTWYETDRGSCWYFRKQIGSDPHLVACLRVRRFADGRYDVLPKIENGYLNVAGPTSKSATYTFSLNGTQKFSQAVDLPHHCHFFCISGSDLSYWDAAGPAHDVWAHDSRDHVESAGWFPAIDPAIDYTTWPGDNVATYTPLMQGMFRLGMAAGGGHFSIGLFPRWDVAAHVSRDEASAKTQIRMAMAYGRYGVHYRDETTGVVPKAIDYPTLGANQSALSGLKDPGNAEVYTPAPSGTAPPEWARSHNPAPPYAAARKTGEWWFAEECQFQAMIGHWMNGFSRSNEQGLISSYYLETRAVAWPMRNLFMAADITPDGHPVKTELVRLADNNIEKFATLATNPFGIIGIGVSGATTQPWQHAFLVATFGWGLAQRLGSTPTIRGKLNTFFHWLGKSVVMRLGGNGATEWNVRDATGSPLGNSAIAPVMNPQGPGALADNYIQETGLAANGSPAIFFSSPGEMINVWMRHLVQQPPHNQPDPGPLSNPGPGPLRGGFMAEADGPWGNLQMEVGYCQTFGVEGIEAGVARMKAASNWTDLLNSAIAGAPEYFFTKATLGGAPSAGYIPPAGQRAIVTLNNSTDVDPDGGAPAPGKWYNGFGGGNSLSGMSCGSWSWGVWCPDIKEVRFKGGGHGANIADFSAGVSAITRQWSQSGYPQNVPPTIAWTGMDGLSGVGNHNPANDLRNTTFRDYDYTIPTGQPHAGSVTKISLTPHTYASLGYIPPGCPGVGAKGAIAVSLATLYQQPNDEPISLWLHDLETGLNVRATNAAPLHSNVGEIMAIDDSVNRRFWQLVGNGNTTAYYYKWDDALPKPRYTATWTFEAGEFSSGYPPLYDWMYTPVEVGGEMWWLLHAGEGSVGGHASFFLAKVVSGAPVMTNIVIPQLNGTSWGGRAMLVIWNPGVSKFYVWEGRGATFMHVLTPSTLNFRTCTWAWTKESFSGPTPADYTSGLTDSAARAQSQYAPGRRGGYIGDNAMLIVDGPGGTGTNVAGTNVAGPGFIWTAPGTPI